MRISNNYSPIFGLKFVNNYALKDVKTYAQKTQKTDILENAIKRLEQAQEGLVTIEHGIDEKNKNFSEFMLNGFCVINTPYFDETFVEATYRAIIDLANLGSRYRVLIKSDMNHRLQ